MSKEFNVNEYWLKRGQAYMGEARMNREFYRAQEQFLLEVIRRGELKPGTILDLGCGYGRISRLLVEHFPAAQIIGLDLSPDQVENARGYCTGLPGISFQQYDFYSEAPFPGSNYDLALAIEVFLHHPEPLVSSLLQKLSRVSGTLLNLDWSEPWPWTRPEHVWVHDYARLYADAGLQCATFPLPEKLEGKQQKVFVAGRSLPDALIRLEREMLEGGTAPSVRAEAPADPSDPAAWLQQLQLAREEVLRIVPPGNAFILVDEGQWGEGAELHGRRILPFLERDGEYWGRPEDDQMGIQELERMCRLGPTHLVFAWPAFWWLEHYSKLNKYLEHYLCVLKSQRVLIYRLKS